MEQDRERELREVPMRPVDKSTWPKGLRTIATEELDALAVDKNDMLYWHGKPVQVRRTLELRSYELTLLTLATIGALLQGVAAMFPVVPETIRQLFK